MDGSEDQTLDGMEVRMANGTKHRSGIGATALGFFCGIAASHCLAANLSTFLDDPSGLTAAIGPAAIATAESFSTAVDGAAVPAAPTSWNGFTAQIIGAGSSAAWGISTYCQSLSLCIPWNTGTPATAGIYGVVDGPGVGISFKPKSNAVVGFSFDFSDWNDIAPRSEFKVIASDGTVTTVNGPIHAPNAPPQNFGVALSPADIAAGVHVQEIRWIGLPGQTEVVGFFNVRTFLHPALMPTQPIPTLSHGGLLVVSLSMASMFWILRRRHGR